MRGLVGILPFAVFWSVPFVVPAAADDVSVVESIAALSDFTTKLDALEQTVDDIAIAGALALLDHEYPGWEFSGSSGFGSVNTNISNDLGAVAASHEYSVGKIRGALFRNEIASEEQRELALQILEEVKALILASYELDGFIAGGEMAAAGQFYRNQIVNQANAINEDIDQLTHEIEQAIKFSGI